MAAPPFEIQVDATRRCLRVLLRGYWDGAIAGRYGAALSEQVAKLDRLSGPTWWLIDIRDFEIQSAEVASVMGGALTHLLTGGERIAMVTPRALASMQAQRTSSGHSHRRFDTMAEAEAWLAQEQGGLTAGDAKA